MALKAAVVILNWNGWSDTIDLLNSLEEVDYQSLSVVVIDNASSDESVERIEEWMRQSQSPYRVLQTPKDLQEGALENIASKMGSLGPGFNLVCSHTNLGFCRGNNLGMELAFQSGTDIAVVLNNDTLVSKGFLAPMVDVVENNPDVGVVGGVITYCSDPNIIWYAGGKFNRFLTAHRLGNGEPLSSLKATGPFDTEWISGCMTLIPAWVYEKTKGFSEEYFIWSEEWDHSLRVSQAGYRLVVVPAARICHKVGKSLGVMKPLNYYYGIRNGLLFQRKFLPSYLWYLYFGYYLVNRAVRYLQLALVGRADLALAGFAAIRDFILGRSGMWRAQKRNF